jgi:hypothetical protein
MEVIIYNQTVQVENGIVGDWLHWIVNEQAPRMVATNCFTKFTVLKLLEQDDAENSTFAIQYFSKDINDFRQYENEFAEQLNKESFAKWGDKIFTFSTTMKVVQ